MGSLVPGSERLKRSGARDPTEDRRTKTIITGHTYVLGIFVEVLYPYTVGAHSDRVVERTVVEEPR